MTSFFLILKFWLTHIVSEEIRSCTILCFIWNSSDNSSPSALTSEESFLRHRTQNSTVSQALLGGEKMRSEILHPQVSDPFPQDQDDQNYFHFDRTHLRPSTVDFRSQTRGNHIKILNFFSSCLTMFWSASHHPVWFILGPIENSSIEKLPHTWRNLMSTTRTHPRPLDDLFSIKFICT